MLCVAVPPEFEDLVNSQISAERRLGGRLIDAGEQAGKLFVSAALIHSAPEWSADFARWVNGGTAVNPDGSLSLEAGRTISFRDSQGGPDHVFEILDLTPAEIFSEIS